MPFDDAIGKEGKLPPLHFKTAISLGTSIFTTVAANLPVAVTTSILDASCTTCAAVKTRPFVEMNAPEPDALGVIGPGMD
jgi:hypothetical protein